MPQQPKQRISSGFLTHSDADYLELPVEDRRGYCDPEEMAEWLDFGSEGTQDEIDRMIADIRRTQHLP